MKFKDIKHLPHDASGIKNPEDWEWVGKEGKYLPQTKAIQIPSTLVRIKGRIIIYKT